MASFNFLDYCNPCGAWCCKGEAPYASKEELTLLNVKKIGQRADGSCQFLKRNQCTEYQLRPLECRLFPFDIKEIEGALTWILWLNCPANAVMEVDENLTRFEQDILVSWSIQYIKDYVAYHRINEPPKYAELPFTKIRSVNFVKHKQ